MDENDRQEVENAPEYDIPALRAALLAHLGEHASVYPKALEAKFPRILARIVEDWGKPDLDAYLESLMVSDRAGRQGFPADVAMEVFSLSTLYGSLGLAPKKVAGVGWAGIEDAEFFKHHVTRDSE